MCIVKDAYVEGYEYYGGHTRKTRGWVDKVHHYDDYTVYDIQADDCYGGARGTLLSTKLGAVVKLEHKERL